MLRWTLGFVLCLSPLAASANASLSARVDSALAFLQSQQSNGQDGYDYGQWRSQVTSTVIEGVGVGHFGVPYEEPTAFVAASVANILAELYMADPRYSRVPGMVSRAKVGLSSYRNGSVYNFYPPKKYKNIMVRGPRYMYLAPQWWGFTNTPADADTTSVSFLLGAYDQALQAKQSPLKTGLALPPGTTQQLAQHRDVNRVPHLYNGLHAYQWTGAFLTWIFDETNPKMPRNWFAPPDQGVRIPFNKNDVDCVVNANVLKMLTVAGKTSTPGYRETCNYINKIAQEGRFYNCGMYYPSTYALPYTIAAGLSLGVKCLEPSRKPIVDRMIDEQLYDGSFRNHWKARADYVQSTAWALNIILAAGDPKNAEHREAAQSALDFLMSQAKRDSAGRLYWEGEVFYAAIFIVRFPVVWRSTAYTTATVAKAMAIAEKKWNLR